MNKLANSKPNATQDSQHRTFLETPSQFLFLQFINFIYIFLKFLNFLMAFTSCNNTIVFKFQSFV